MSTDPLATRRLALQILEDIDESDAYANLLLSPRLARAGMRGRDAAFVTELVYGTARQRGRLDAIIEIAAQRPLARIDPGLDLILRLGAYQILDLAVANHGAVDTSVQLARQYFGAGRSGFVNAVLRAIAAETDWPARLAQVHSGDDLLGALTAHPTWIVRAWRDALIRNGRPASELQASLAANNVAPAVTLVARPGLADRADLPGVTPTVLSPYGATMSGGNPAGLAQVQRAQVGVQDEGSQLAALALAQADVAKAGPQRWWDMCAGPGGKAALLGALAGAAGHTLLATEISKHRADLVRSSLAAVDRAWPGVVTVTAHDALTVDAAGFDKILLDAPCTGLGALRRRPESRWRRKPADLATLTALQRSLLTAAIAAARPGAVITYVTCSPHVAETHLIIDAALATGAVQACDTGAVAGLDSAERVQLWPHVHGTDAMFIASLRRTDT